MTLDCCFCFVLVEPQILIRAAFSISKTGSIDKGNRFGKLAFALYEKFNAKPYLARLSLFYYVAVHVWTKPVEMAVQPLIDAYHAGIESGDVEYAFTCYIISWTIRFPITPLKHLDSILQDISQWSSRSRKRIFVSSSLSGKLFAI